MHILSPLSCMVATYNEHTEHSKPFHSQNAPFSHRLSSFPFTCRLHINPKACHKDNMVSFIANQQIWLTTPEGHNTLVVFTDRLKTERAMGWAIKGIHAGQLLFSHKVPLAKQASNHDAKMMALAYASKLVQDTMFGMPDIREFQIFSNSTAALTSIFNPAPHTAQQASLLFCSNMLHLFSQWINVWGKMEWTPGHGGLDHMTITDKNTKAATNHATKTQQYPFPSSSPSQQPSPKSRNDHSRNGMNSWTTSKTKTKNLPKSEWLPSLCPHPQTLNLSLTSPTKVVQVNR